MSIVVDKHRHLTIARLLVNVLEKQFRIGKWEFGLDPILGLIPVIGDLIPTILACYLIWIAVLHELPTMKVIHMGFNVVLDFIVGSIPVIGDIFDFFIKPSVSNLRILEKHLAFSDSKTRTGPEITLDPKV